jgi:DNA-binding response OmpR family regulator
VTRILVVDDDPDVRQFVVVNLSAQGWECIEAEDGEQGLELALVSAPDLILTGSMMPKMDGLEVVRRLRADPRTNAIPVVMLTARSRPEDMEQGLAAGADDYITKPFEPRYLIARLRGRLARHGSASAPIA